MFITPLELYRKNLVPQSDLRPTNLAKRKRLRWRGNILEPM
jgi:hypothetical protein